MPLEAAEKALPCSLASWESAPCEGILAWSLYLATGQDLKPHPLGLGPGGPVGERAGVTLELPGQGALIPQRAVLPRQPESSRVQSTQLKRDLGICSRFK